MMVAVGSEWVQRVTDYATQFCLSQINRYYSCNWKSISCHVFGVSATFHVSNNAEGQLNFMSVVNFTFWRLLIGQMISPY